MLRIGGVSIQDFPEGWERRIVSFGSGGLGALNGEPGAGELVVEALAFVLLDPSYTRQVDNCFVEICVRYGRMGSILFKRRVRNGLERVYVNTKRCSIKFYKKELGFCGVETELIPCAIKHQFSKEFPPTETRILDNLFKGLSGINEKELRMEELRNELAVSESRINRAFGARDRQREEDDQKIMEIELREIAGSLGTVLPDYLRNVSARASNLYPETMDGGPLRIDFQLERNDDGGQDVVLRVHFQGQDMEWADLPPIVKEFAELSLRLAILETKNSPILIMSNVGVGFEQRHHVLLYNMLRAQHHQVLIVNKDNAFRDHFINIIPHLYTQSFT